MTPLELSEETLSCGITYDHHSDDSRGVIYAPKEYSIVRASLMMIVIYNCHICIVQATSCFLVCKCQTKVKV
jgi:hypothetical protein